MFYKLYLCKFDKIENLFPSNITIINFVYSKLQTIQKEV